MCGEGKSDGTIEDETGNKARREDRGRQEKISGRAFNDAVLDQKMSVNLRTKAVRLPFDD